MKEQMRLQKLMAMCGVASRRASEKLILEGRVKVNGQVVRELGTKASLDDEITVDGNSIVKEEKVYFLLYKPTGYLTTVSDDKGRRTVMDLMGAEARNNRIFPIGRLDYDTSGALLMTNDGELMNRLLNSANNVEKEYLARINGHMTLDEVAKLKKGILLDGVMTKSAQVYIDSYDKKYNTTLVRLVITEGKNRQVRRMFEAVGHQLIRLHRESIGNVFLKGMKPGEYRILKPQEVKDLRALALERKERNKNFKKTPKSTWQKNRRR